MRPYRLIITLAVAVATAALIAACGSSNSSDNNASHHKTKTVVKTVTAPVKSTSTTATTPVTTTVTKPGIAECNTTDLVAGQLANDGAAGTIVLPFTLKNVGQSPCYTYGWPGIGFLDADGGLLPTTPTRVTSDVLGPVKAKAITLDPGAEASFRVVNHDVGSKCANAATIEITPPNDTATLKLKLNGGLTTCGNATVTPMQPGLAAQPSGT